MYNKNFFYQSNKLTNLDLIQKYNLLTLFKVPAIYSINITISLDNLISVYTNTLINKNNSVKIKSFLICYFFFNLIPYLSENSIKIEKTIEQNTQSNCYLKIILKNKISINNFLINFFVENWFNFSLDERLIIKTAFEKTLSKTDNFLINVPITLNRFFTMDTLVLAVLPGINTKDINLLINFAINISTKLPLTERNLILKNLPLVWISG